jgi:hypothetical protein
MDKWRPDQFAIEPFIEQSTIFVASRSEHFKPVRVALESPRVDGRDWNVFRTPVLSPDRGTVYFLVPAGGTSWFLMTVPVLGGTATPITWVEAYCVLWGGKHPGDLFVSVRKYPADATQHLSHDYYRYDASRHAERVGNSQRKGTFQDFVHTWTRQDGATCEPNIN